MTGWDKEYLHNKKDYMELFDRVMQKEQESNVEFLEKNLSKRLGRNVVVCANGTDALHFALLSKNIGAGDEVLVTNFSWISTASVISMTGATPVFCDIDIDTYHMCFESIKKMYSDKVKAIIYPHLFGNMSDTSTIKEFCKEKNIIFIEDACQSLGSSYNGVLAGTIGDISTLSFNANKVVAGISGGGAIITDGDTEIFKKLRKHGNNEILGYNSKMLLFNAEVINYRLNKLDDYIERKREIAKQYDEALRNYVVVQSNTGGHNYHKYVIRLQNKKLRDKLKEKLGAKVHYENPISENKMYNNIKHRKDITYTSKIISDTVLTLPIHPYMTKGEVDKITNTILIILEQDNNRFVDSMKKVIGDDLFDKSLINETTEDIYDHIVEKTYQLPEYIEEVDFKDKRKLKIAFNKFYNNLQIKTIKKINGRRQNMFEPINQINTSNFYKILPESKSQLRQDMFVLNEFNFKRDGYFIEVGAADGFDSSNTYLLENKFNWKGILAEPAKNWHKDLKENRKGDIETNCIWKTSGDELIFNEVDGENKQKVLSTIDIFTDIGYRNSKIRKAFGKKYKVKTISLIDLLLKYNAPTQIDYLSIDTEGSEFEILNAFNFDLYDIKIITCEHNNTPDRKKIYNLLVKNGYKRKFEEFSNPIEDWYVK